MFKVVFKVKVWPFGVMVSVLLVYVSVLRFVGIPLLVCASVKWALIKRNCVVPMKGYEGAAILWRATDCDL